MACVSLTSTHSSLILHLVISRLLPELVRKGTPRDRQTLPLAVQKPCAVASDEAWQWAKLSSSGQVSANMVLTAHHSFGSDAESMMALFYLFLLIGKCSSSQQCFGGAAWQ